jgi:hypothetical protein
MSETIIRDILLILIFVQVLAGFVMLLVCLLAMWLLWPRSNGRSRLYQTQDGAQGGQGGNDPG